MSLLNYSIEEGGAGAWRCPVWHHHNSSEGRMCVDRRVGSSEGPSGYLGLKNNGWHVEDKHGVDINSALTVFDLLVIIHFGII